MNKIKELEAYELLETRWIADLNSDGCILRHKKTGACLTLLLNDDENKVFYIGFRTPPENSTGVAHIIEHSVLCGSKEFPVKDPFIELAKGSLNTFLNAMTYPDKTVYPVASCNDKDFKNLMHVYLDAVFYPNIYKEEKIFKQEGWHYEMESMESPLSINGVVYNEMKGAFSSPDDVVEREIMNSLYPDTSYGMESGGDPDVIPELTYEEFLNFHRKFYHPSNSFLYLYGNLDAEEYLTFIDEHYLSHFEKIEVDSQIVLQQAFEKPRRIKKQYSVMEEDDIDNSTYLTYNISMGSSLDRKLYVTLDVLDYVLCSAPGAPIKQALIDQGIGQDVYSSVENGIRQPYFSIIAKDAASQQQEQFLSIIEQELKKAVCEGVDRKSLQAAINYFEFRYREADFGSYPRGLMLGLQSLDSWLYDKNQPFLHIEANETYAELKRDMETDYYEQFIQTYFLDNPHKAFLVVEPVRGLTSKKDKKLAERLQVYKEHLTEVECQQIVQQTKELHDYQQEPSPKEELEKIPLLTREDMKKEAAPYQNEVRGTKENQILFHEIYTNGIGYLNLIFDLKEVDKELFPYVGILKTVMMMVDTEKYSYGELYNEIHIQTGGMKATVNTYTNANRMDECMATFELRSKFLYEQRNQAWKLIEEVLLHADFSDTKRLYEILAEAKSRMQASMTSAGHSVSAIRTLSYFSPSAAISEQLSGIPQYRLLEKIIRNYDTCKEELVSILNRLCRLIFRTDHLLVDYTSSEEGYEGLEEAAESFRHKLYEAKEQGDAFTIELEQKNEGFTTAGQVQYVCRAGNFIKEGLPYHGSLKVLKVMMGYDYLWNKVRVVGGAYGCMCNFFKNGDAYFVSYRDPNLEKTVQAYEEAADYIQSCDLDERTITQFIIGAISELDTPMTPSTKGLYSLGGYLTGLSMERVQQERDELLQTTPEILHGLSRYVAAFMKQGNVCVVGNEEKIRENRNMFKCIDPLFHS